MLFEILFNITKRFFRNILCCYHIWIKNFVNIGPILLQIERAYRLL